MYNCGICDKEFETITERNRCEAACIRRVEEEAKKAEEAKKQAEKEERKAEVTAAIKYANELLGEFVKDYGSYEYESEAGYEPNHFWPSKMLSWFM